ncbi:MAG: Phage polymerase-related protein [Gemmatimonadetes bacterium]|jgi:uracil-DNA glycosylase family protein|nr:Phage polymerase-related protein [Gemmatimonadota bacterium]
MTKQSGTASTTGTAADFLPARRTLPALRRAAAGCRGCHLWRVGTQTVFGEGARASTLMLVGEQPGDQEDQAGHPFVGPAGKLLDSALERAGIERSEAYVTNAVKHFKWVRDERGKRRIHKTPNSSEIRACHPWLESELAVVKPRVIVALGATAAKALFGPTVRVLAQRGKPLATTLAERGFVTVHPSAVLRSPSGERERAEKAFVNDLKKVAKYLDAV